MKRWHKIVLGTSGVIAALIACGWLLPSTQQVERQTIIRATPKAVFPLIATLKRWPEWTAWTVDRFPDLVTRFEGPDTGPGAIMVASGKSSGDGTVTITHADVASGIHYTLDFSHGTQLFDGAISMSPQGDDLAMTWKLTADLGANPFKRWAGLAMGALMGTDMASGLEKLRKRVEHSP